MAVDERQRAEPVGQQRDAVHREHRRDVGELVGADPANPYTPSPRPGWNRKTPLDSGRAHPVGSGSCTRRCMMRTPLKVTSTR
jgi:hypothetical protein